MATYATVPTATSVKFGTSKTTFNMRTPSGGAPSAGGGTTTRPTTGQLWPRPA